MWIASEGAIKRDLNNPLTSDIIAALQDPTASQPPVAPTGFEIERADVLADGRVVVDYVIVVPPGSGMDPAELEATSIFINEEDGLWRIEEEVDTGTMDLLARATPGSGFTRGSLAPRGTPPAGG